MIRRRGAKNMALYTDIHFHVRLVTIESSFKTRVLWILKDNSWE
jgi:hypothetical protein